MKYTSRKDGLFRWIFWGALAIVIGIPSLSLIVEDGVDSMDKFLAIGVSLVVSGFLMWIYFGTHYTVDQEYVRWRSGPLFGKIRLESIHQVVVGKTLWIGLRPATALNGVIIKYNKYSEIYFSPSSNDHFVEDILRGNPNIQVVKGKE